MPVADHLGGVCCGRSSFERAYDMKTTNYILPRVLGRTLLLTLLLSSTAFSQLSKTNQVVTLQVVELNALSVSTQYVSLVSKSIDREPKAATQLIWTSNGEERKITVARKAIERGWPLRIAVRNPGETVVEKGLELNDSTTLDLLQGLSRSAGSCVIEFSVRAVMDHIGGTDFQTIVYTITGG